MMACTAAQRPRSWLISNRPSYGEAQGRACGAAHYSTILPPDLFMKYVDMTFWENDKLNTKKVLIL